MLLHRKNCVPYYTEEDMKEINQALLDFDSSFRSTIGSETLYNTIKMHKMRHAVDVIKRFGDLKHIHAQFYEAGNADTKKDFRASKHNENRITVVVIAMVIHVYNNSTSCCDRHATWEIFFLLF